MDEALQAAMLSSEIELFPDLWSAALDEVFAVGIGRRVVDHELDYLLSPVVATMTFDQPIDRCFDLKQFDSRSVFKGKVEQQVAVNCFGLTS